MVSYLKSKNGMNGDLSTVSENVSSLQILSLVVSLLEEANNLSFGL